MDGFEFTNDGTGVLAVDVRALKPQTSYYFKIRAGNGCMPGEWSKILLATTGSSSENSVTSFSTGSLSSSDEDFADGESLEVNTATLSATARPTPSPSPTSSAASAATEDSGKLSLLQRFWMWLLKLFGRQP